MQSQDNALYTCTKVVELTLADTKFTLNKLYENFRDDYPLTSIDDFFTIARSNTAIVASARYILPYVYTADSSSNLRIYTSTSLPFSGQPRSYKAVMYRHSEQSAVNVLVDNESKPNRLLLLTLCRADAAQNAPPLLEEMLQALTSITDRTDLWQMAANSEFSAEIMLKILGIDFKI